ncbi:MAG: hypothetical protein RSA79_03730 [Oscillospiraceae bacterium]
MANKDNNAKNKQMHSNPPMQYQPTNTGTNCSDSIVDNTSSNSIADNTTKSKAKNHKTGKNNIK